MFCPRSRPSDRVAVCAGGAVVDVDVSPNEEPILVLSNRQAFLFHSGMR